MRFSHWILIGLLGAVPAMVGACGSNGGGTASNLHGGSGGTAGSSTGGSGGGSAADAGMSFDSGGSGAQCSTSQPCDAGVCVSGKCCPTVERACGDQCCDSGQVCLFNQCVVPGKACQSAADCGSGEYCETALGNQGDAGAADAGGSTDGGPACTQPVAANGRCVPLPPKCVGDAGAPDGGTCIEDCQYHPPVGKLTAVKKWQWGLDNPPVANPNAADVWSTPTVARVYDANCDGKVDENDPPDIIFVSGNVNSSQCNGKVNRQPDGTSACQRGRLRMLDGRTGKEIWTLAKPSAGSLGFAGSSVALGDVDGDGRIDIVAMTGEGKVAMVSADGKVERISDKPQDQAPTGTYGWGGGVALGDMDGDGHPEIAFGRCLFDTKNNAITLKWCGTAGNGGGNSHQLSFFADLDGNGQQDLVAGNTAYKYDGSMLWNKTAIPNGFNAVADFNGDGKPDVVVVHGGQVWILQGATGNTELGPATLPGTGSGGPPTVADFDGDKKPEVGVAQQNLYSMLKPDYAKKKLNVVWSTPNHDLSSSVTGSSVFDFQGDGQAEVIYNDECFLWVFDGKTGHVVLSEPTTSFTGTEASVVADVDGDGHAEIVMISNGADPSSNGWKCDVAPWNKVSNDPDYPHIAWKPPSSTEPAYRGITVWGDKENSWVGTRTIWNEHAYHVTNICDSRDSACDPPNVYGSIPTHEKDNWKQSWLNNFRQNVQDKGVFDAPDATVSLAVECTDPVVLHVSVRNIGLAGLPSGIKVGIYVVKSGVETQIGTVVTTQPLLPGQTQVLDFTAPASATTADTFIARIIIDPNNKTFNECRADNNASKDVKASGCGPT
jgi:hypothetical protein